MNITAKWAKMYVGSIMIMFAIGAILFTSLILVSKQLPLIEATTSNSVDVPITFAMFAEAIY